MSPDTASSALTMLGVVAILSSGGVVPQMPGWLEWLRSVFWTSWAFHLLLENEVERLPAGGLVYSPCSESSGLASQSGNQLGEDFAVLGGIAAAMVLFAWGALCFQGWRRKL